MSDATTLTLALLVAGLVLAFSFSVRQEFQQHLKKARKDGARMSRDRAVELVRHYASVAPPNYQTMYSSLATKLEEMSLE